jgi:hypothetical protein
VDLLEKGMGFGARVTLSFQNYAALEENYGEFDAKVIASECASKIFLRSDVVAAEAITSMVGKERRHERETGTSDTTSHSTAQTTGSNTGTAITQGLGADSRTTSQGTQSSTTETRSTSHTSTTTIKIVERDVLLPGDLEALPLVDPAQGVRGYAKGPQIPGKIWEFHYPGFELEPVVGMESMYDPNFIDRSEKEDEEYQDLRDWTPVEMRGLGFFEHLSKLGLDTERGEKRRREIAVLKELERTIEAEARAIAEHGFYEDREATEEELAELEKLGKRAQAIYKKHLATLNHNDEDPLGRVAQGSKHQITIKKLEASEQ